MATWQLQQAKAQLSEVINQAQTQGPQFITRHGDDRAVLLSIGEYARLNGGSDDLIDHLLNGPKVEGFEVTRDHAVGGREFEFELEEDE